jgi:seryl-tRNA synthetase
LPPSSPSTPARTSRNRRDPANSDPTPPEGGATLDLKQIRRDPDSAREALARRGAAEQLDELLRLDGRRRELQPELEQRRSLQRQASDEIGEAKRRGEDAEAKLAEMRELSARLKEMDAELAQIRESQQELLASLPNLPHPETPDGETDEDAVELRQVREPPQFAFEPRDHLELGQRHGWIEMEAAAESSGSRFAYLLGDLVFLEFALVRYALELLREEGFTAAVPPVLVRERALFGTGFFPGEREMIYEVPRDELFLVGTSEVSLASLHFDETLERETLPRRYAGFSTCFRREAGAAGRDTRGIFRVHQFDKVEMFSFCEPEHSREEHERILALQERILQELQIPYRVVDIPVGELGASAARKFDCEAWIPSESRYRELTSCSNTTDYQARRLGARFKRAQGADSEPVHTLNGTAVAVGRTLIALIENGQDEDGEVELPEVLKDFGAPRRIPSR